MISVNLKEIYNGKKEIVSSKKGWIFKNIRKSINITDELLFKEVCQRNCKWLRMACSFQIKNTGEEITLLLANINSDVMFTLDGFLDSYLKEKRSIKDFESWHKYYLNMYVHAFNDIKKFESKLSDINKLLLEVYDD